MLRNLLVVLVFISFSANIGFVLHYLSTRHEHQHHQQSVAEVVRGSIRTTTVATDSPTLEAINSIPTLAPSIPFLAVNADRNAIQNWLRDVSSVVTLSPTNPPTLPTESPVLPTESPTIPTESPVLPTDSPTIPTKSPTLPTDLPTILTEPPTIPAEPPTNFTEPPTLSTRRPTKPRLTQSPTMSTMAPVPVLRNVTTYLIPEENTNKYPVCAWCNQVESHFLASALPNFTYLASFPGSGNNWIISQLNIGTRLNHCSVYDYNGTYASQFDFHRCVVTKTHYPFYKTQYDAMYPNETFIYLLRSPFDAIQAELFRRGIQGNEISNYFAHFARKWKVHVDLHVGRRYWKNTRRYQRVDTAGTVRFFLKQARPRKQMVVFYEDFRTHQVQSMRNLFQFLKLQFGNSTPSVEDSLTCALETDWYLSGTQTSRGRKKMHTFAIPSNVNLTRMACEMWKDYWFEEMWGPCMDDQYRYYSKDVTLAAVNASEEHKLRCYSAWTREMWV